MADINNAEGCDTKVPKEGGFNLSNLSKHIAEIDTSLGKLYLFPLKDTDVQTFNSLSTTDNIDRTRKLLTSIASLSSDHGLKHERVSITSDQVTELSDETIETIAESFTSSNAFRRKDRPLIPRTAGELATEYLNRLMRNQFEEDATQLKKLKEQILGSTQSIFDQVRKVSVELGDTRDQLERLTKTNSFSEGAGRASNFETPSFTSTNQMRDYSARMERERSEDREIMRLMGRASAQSAAMLQELEAASSKMLEKLDERDKDAKKTTKSQLQVAVWSVTISAILALFALVFSIAAYYQDKGNISSGDKWQASVLEELKAANQKTSKAESLNQQLVLTVEQLRARILEVESQANTAPAHHKMPPK